MWQRGTSFAVAAGVGTFTADRWQARSAGNALTVSRVAAEGSGRYGLKLQRNAGQTNGSGVGLLQVIEHSNMCDLAGKTVTLSLSMKTGANYSGGTVRCTPVVGTAIEESSANLYTGTWTGYNAYQQAAYVDTTMQRFTYAVDIPADTKELGIHIYYIPSGTAGADDSLTIEDVQLEVGPQATPFERRPIGLELTLCQRYYEALSPFGAMLVYNQNTSTSLGTMEFKTSKRNAGGTLKCSALSAFNPEIAVTPTAITIDRITTENMHVNFTGTGGGASGTVGRYITNSGTAWLAYDCEL